MEVLHVMPDKFLAENSAPAIAEIMAYYKVKDEERSVEKQRHEIEMQRRAASGRRR